MIPVLVMLLLSILTPSIETSTLENEDQTQATSGRQGSLDVDCSGYTFEDLFEYDFALFNLDINDDWATGAMDAQAWVNGSKSAVVRDNLDGLFEGVPGGDDDWMSTDEREAVRSIGPKCIADMETRLGIREGIAHRGSVDWNDLEFVEDGIALDEVNLVPDDHPQERDCSSALSGQGCKEVPVTITDDLEIHLLTDASENHNVRFDQLPNQGSSNFTLAMNVTNITDARLVLTFPVEQGLRVADLGFYDDGVLQDELATPISEFLPDGRLRVVADVDYPLGSYPMIRNLFIDFTTQAPFTNEVLFGLHLHLLKVPSSLWASPTGKNLLRLKLAHGLLTKVDGTYNVISVHLTNTMDGLSAWTRMLLYSLPQVENQPLLNVLESMHMGQKHLNIETILLGEF